LSVNLANLVNISAKIPEI